MAILAGVGPMGLGAIDYAIHSDRRPGLLVVTDINEDRLERAKIFYSPVDAARNGVRLIFVNTQDVGNVPDRLLAFTDSKGFDDVFVFAPVRFVIETGDKILGKDGCLNFFAGPTDSGFSAEFNFYNVHYMSTHIVGTSGGNTDDMIESLHLMSQGRINPAVMITHVGGLNAVVDATLNLPQIPGGKKLIYTNIEMDLASLSDFKTMGEKDPLFQELSRLVEAHHGLWSVEAEEYLLANAKKISERF